MQQKEAVAPTSIKEVPELNAEEKCNEQAGEARMKSPLILVNENGKWDYSYSQHHYKCFSMNTESRTDSKTGVNRRSINLIEVNEKKNYGSYIERTTKNDEHFIQCDIGEKCLSEDDFNKYIKTLMEN